MGRKTFADILKNSQVSVSKEYNRLVELFYYTNYGNKYTSFTLYEFVKSNFDALPFKDTCISLDDFNETYRFAFPRQIKDSDIDTLILLCEYTHSLLTPCSNYIEMETIAPAFFIHLDRIIEKVGYMGHQNDDGIYICVPKNSAAFEVAAITQSPLDYKTIEYNHHSLKGKLENKLGILKLMADDIELQRPQLKNANSTLESSLFQMFQKFVRHNNSENQYIVHMTPQEIEATYDDIYQMWLLAKLELDNMERNKRVKELLGKINS